MVSRIRIGPEGGPFVEIDEDNGTLKFDAPSNDVDLTGNDLKNAVLLGATLGGALDADGQDINNADTVTTENLVVNNTATGPFGGGGAPVLQAGDSITVETVDFITTDEAFVTLYDGTAKDVLGGIIGGSSENDFVYTFSDSSTLRKNGTGTTYDRGNRSRAFDSDGNSKEFDIMPPAKSVTKIEVGSNIFQQATMGAEVILKD